jgi:hypothetical protein
MREWIVVVAEKETHIVSRSVGFGWWWIKTQGGNMKYTRHEMKLEEGKCYSFYLMMRRKKVR